jgi:hypothetical protein
MVWLARVRAVSGFAAVLTLLGLVIADFASLGMLTPERTQVLVGLIAALLGLDMAADYLPLTVETDRLTVEVGHADPADGDPDDEDETP